MHLLRRKWLLSRRACLRGLGAALALPMLDAMRAPRAEAQTLAYPKRFFTIYAPHGFDMPSWTPALPAGKSRSMTFVDEAFEITSKRALSALAPYRDDLIVISGLGNAPANKGDFNGSHARGTGCSLTCAELTTTSDFSQIQNGVSLDQLMAGAIGAETPLKSLELGVRSGDLDGDCEDGYSCAYLNNIAWSGPSQPAPKQTKPSDVFNRLIGVYQPPSTSPAPQAPPYTGDSSILSHMKDDANRLYALVGTEDRVRVQEYLDGVAELERRLQKLETGGSTPTLSCAAPGAPADPASYEEHVRLMFDMVLFAFQCDLTRVATFMMENPFNSRDYNFIGVSGNSHEISHHGGDETKLEKIRKINEWQTQQVAYFLDKLKSSTEGDGSVLDNSLVYYTSEFGDGDDHYHHDLPVVVAGSGGGAFKTGRHVCYAGPVGGGLNEVDESKPLANLYVSFLNAMGIAQSSFGDNGSGPLTELTS